MTGSITPRSPTMSASALSRQPADAFLGTLSAMHGGSPAIGNVTSEVRSDSLALCHPESRRVRRVRLGFAWSVMLLGPLPFVHRGQWALALQALLLCLLLPFVGQVWAARQASRWEVRSLLAQGYRALRTRPGAVSAAEWQLGMNLPRL